MTLFEDTSFWVLLAAVGFAIVFWKKGRAPVLNIIDARAQRISDALDEAERLKNEAQSLLADSQKKHHNALQTAEKILADAKDSADRLRTDAEKKLAEDMDRREKQLLARIAQAEQKAVDELKANAARKAAAAAEQLLRDQMDKQDKKLVEQAVEKIGTARLSA
ncbi:MAG: F0F1 ATP synthase subunit B [Alphaproteobacteria bacterium]|nr:F0F1 ATP synthase subunit B [Alphaproteobacteria bacterium]